MHVKICFQLCIEVNDYTTSKVSNISYEECKKKDDGMDQNTLHYCYGEYVTANQQS